MLWIYCPELDPGIHGHELEMQACISVAGLQLLLPESELGLIRTSLTEIREGTGKLQQKVESGSNLGA